MISTFLLGQGGQQLHWIFLKKKVPFALWFFFWKEILYGMAQQKTVSEGQYSKKMLSTIALLIWNILMDGLMHVWHVNTNISNFIGYWCFLDSSAG